MWHIFAKHNNQTYYICSASEEVYAKNIFAIYKHLYSAATFSLEYKHLSRIALGHLKLKSCLEFVNNYAASNFQVEQIGE